MLKKLSKDFVIERIGFILEVTLFVLAGYLWAHEKHTIALTTLFIGIMVALYVGELIIKNGCRRFE